MKELLKVPTVKIAALIARNKAMNKIDGVSFTGTHSLAEERP